MKTSNKVLKLTAAVHETETDVDFIGIGTQRKNTPNRIGAFYVSLIKGEICLFHPSKEVSMRGRFGGHGVRPYLDGIPSSAYWCLMGEKIGIPLLWDALKSGQQTAQLQGIPLVEGLVSIEEVHGIPYHAPHIEGYVFKGGVCLNSTDIRFQESEYWGTPLLDNGDLKQNMHPIEVPAELRKAGINRQFCFDSGLQLATAPFEGLVKMYAMKNGDDSHLVTEEWMRRIEPINNIIASAEGCPSRADGKSAIRRTSLGHWEMKGFKTALPIRVVRNGSTITPPHIIRYASISEATDDFWWYDGVFFNYVLKGDVIETGVN